MTETIDHSRYGGYLAPWIGEIERLWKEGYTCSKIAEILRREVDKRTGYFPLAINIHYVLGRIGYYENYRNPYPIITPVIPPRRYWVDWRAMFRAGLYMASKGRPIDMGGPRDQWIERDPWSDV